jgi:hypothetical protein
MLADIAAEVAAHSRERAALYRRATGPKTRAGKLASRRNATTHGLRCKVVVPPGDERAIAERARSFALTLKPADDPQRWLVARAAVTTVRLDRCVRRELIALHEQTAAAERDWFRRGRARARRLGQLVADDPARAFGRLTGFALGCDWLVARWERLAESLEDPEVGHWSRGELVRAIGLLGLDYRHDDLDEPRMHAFSRLALAADPEAPPEEVDLLLDLDTAHLGPDARRAEHRRLLGFEPDAARLALLALVRAEQESLRARRAWLWEHRDRPALEAACDRARHFDAGPDANLARRYEASTALELARDLNLLARLQRQAALAAGSDAPDGWPAGPDPLPDLAPDPIPTPSLPARPEPAPVPDFEPPVPAIDFPAVEIDDADASEGDEFEDEEGADAADAPAPNELHTATILAASDAHASLTATPSGPDGASPPRPETVPGASATHPEGVAGSIRADRDAAPAPLEPRGEDGPPAPGPASA